jgi:hypothetical protein
MGGFLDGRQEGSAFFEKKEAKKRLFLDVPQSIEPSPNE